MNTVCTLCGQLPQENYHVILTCPFIKNLWRDLTPLLLKIDKTQVTQIEMAFGLLTATPNSMLRNFLTYTMREMVEKQEKKAYYNSNVNNNMIDFKFKFNSRIRKYVQQSFRSSQKAAAKETFEAFFCVNNALATVSEEAEFEIANPFDIP